MTVQVNALSNMRKAKLGRLEPPSQRIDSPKVKYTVGRTLSALPADLVAKHEALVRVNTAKRFAKQGAARCSLLGPPSCMRTNLVPALDLLHCMRPHMHKISMHAPTVMTSSLKALFDIPMAR